MYFAAITVQKSLPYYSFKSTASLTLALARLYTMQMEDIWAKSHLYLEPNLCEFCNTVNNYTDCNFSQDSSY